MYITYHQTMPALGSEATIVLVVNADANVESLFAMLWREVFLFEKRFSRFLPASELSRFNRQAGIRQIISDDFKHLLETVKTMAELTDGMYNPFILPALQKSGYKNSAMPGYENDKVDDFSGRQVVPTERLRLGDNWAEIPYGTALDMGGIGKGYLADKLVDILDKQNLGGYWVSLGGDMVLSGYDEHGLPWLTNIQSAYHADAHAEVSVSHNGERMAVATSGTFRRDSQRDASGHHIIDPRTGKSADTDILLATVVDTSSTRADVLASCAVIAGSHASLKYLQQKHVDSAYIQASNLSSIEFGPMLMHSSNKKLEVIYA